MSSNLARASLSIYNFLRRGLQEGSEHCGILVTCGRKVPHSEQPQSTKVNLTNCLKMRDMAPSYSAMSPASRSALCSPADCSHILTAWWSFPSQHSAVLQGNPCVRLAIRTMMFRSDMPSAGADEVVCEKRSSSEGKSQDAILLAHAWVRDRPATSREQA